MKGSVVRVNWAVVIGVQFLALFVALTFLLGRMDIPQFGGRLPGAPPPAPESMSVSAVLVVFLLTALGVAWVCSLAARRIAEIEDLPEHGLVHLAWRHPIESHWWVGILPGLAAALAWTAQVENALYAPSLGAWLIAGLVLPTCLYSVFRGGATHLAVGDDSLRLDGTEISRASVIGVKESALGHRLQIERTDGASVQVSMLGNSATVRQITRDLILGNEAAVDEGRLGATVGQSRSTRWFGLFLAWTFVFPTLVLVSSLLVQANRHGSEALLFPLLASALFGLIMMRAPQPALARLSDQVVFSPGSDSRLGGWLIHAVLAWWIGALLFVAFDPSMRGMVFLLVFGLLAQLGTLALMGFSLSRWRFYRLRYDAAGVVLEGRSQVRIPWAELVSARYDEGAFPMLFLSTADGGMHGLAVGGAPVSETLQVAAELEARLSRHQASSAAERRSARAVMNVPGSNS